MGLTIGQVQRTQIFVEISKLRVSGAAHRNIVSIQIELPNQEDRPSNYPRYTIST
ncbi:MAG: hypothetical protein ACKV1O_14405 [Saprospiraceae bacterium]